MSESERAAALREVQLELFALKQDYVLRARELKRKLTLIRGGGMKRCRDEECTGLGELMDVEQFYEDPRYTDGYYPYCRECKLRRNAQRKGNVISRGRRSEAA